MRTIDLNLDAGESAEALQDGSEAQLYELVSSVNIACGGHAGNAATMRQAIHLALAQDLAIGAHPGFPDTENFGRVDLKMEHSLLVNSLFEQISELNEICAEEGTILTHVKPHGALYNLAAHDLHAARALIEAVKRVEAKLPIVGLAGSPFIKWCREAGMATISEGFVDRAYEEDGRLRSRDLPGALIEDPRRAGEQALSLVGRVQTLCIHGDSPLALKIARATCATLTQNGVRIDRPRPLMAEE